MYTVTSQEMREIDQFTIEQIGIPAAVLMENAGRGVADAVCRFAREQSMDGPWVILVGKGNNGGDGLVAARHLAEFGIDVDVVYAVAPNSLQGDAALQRDITDRLGIHTLHYEVGTVQWRRYAGIVDALLGTGAHAAPREPYASLIREANDSGLPILAVDIPSGLDADSGQVHEPCIRARQTIALAFMKRGHVQFPGAAVSGELLICPIGIPARLAETMAEPTFVLTPELLRSRLGVHIEDPRRADTHKGTYGHVLIVAGSLRYSGAGLLAAQAALRGGAGLVSWALPAALHAAMIGRQPELILLSMPDQGMGGWEQVPPEAVLAALPERGALVLGPGLDRFAGDAAWLRSIWEAVPDRCPIVTDADALNMIAASPGGMDAMPRRNAPVILTPHPGEMARLCGLPVHEVQRDRIALARRFALQHEVILVLKGARTVVACPDGVVFVNTTGNAGMATAGAGDVLAGLIGGLLAQGWDAHAAAAAGVYWHGAAGDRAAAKRQHPGSLIAGDITREL